MQKSLKLLMQEEEIKRIDPASPTLKSSASQNVGDERGEQGFLLPELDAFFNGGLRSPYDMSRRGLPSPRGGLSPNLLFDKKRGNKIRVQNREHVEVLYRGVGQTHPETSSDGNPCSRQLYERHEEAEVPIGSGCTGTQSREVVGTLSDHELNNEGDEAPATRISDVRECNRKLDYLELGVDVLEKLTCKGSGEPERSLDIKYINEDREVCQETVIEMLRNNIAELKEREMRLEGELLEYYGLQEREDEYLELKRRFEEQTGIIEALKVHNENMEAAAKGMSIRIVANNKLLQELVDARAMIRELQKQLEKEVGQATAEIVTLKQKILTLEMKEIEGARRDVENERKLQALRELEVEVVELRRTCKDIQHQRRELTIKLSAADSQISKLLRSNEVNLMLVSASFKVFSRSESVLSAVNEGLSYVGTSKARS